MAQFTSVTYMYLFTSDSLKLIIYLSICSSLHQFAAADVAKVSALVTCNEPVFLSRGHTHSPSR